MPKNSGSLNDAGHSEPSALEKESNFEYFTYLKQRSVLGLFYRRSRLYPRMCRWIWGRVLDVGCGLGDMLKFRPNTVGVDINPYCVEWCRKQGLKAHLMEPGLLPFPDGLFDGCVLDNVLEHIEHPDELLKEIARILTPRGRCVVGVPGSLGYERDSDHRVFYDKKLLIDTVTRFGFRVRSVEPLPLNLDVLDSMLSSYALYGVFERS